MTMTDKVRGLLIVTATFATLSLATFGFFVYDGHRAQVRVIRSREGSGVLMATNAEGLKRLQEYYARPKACTEAKMRAGGVLAFKLCWPDPIRISSSNVEPGLVLIPEQTRALSMSRRYILPGGVLVDPYPANTYDEARDGAVGVEKVRITQPPFKGLEGWVWGGSLGRISSLGAL